MSNTESSTGQVDLFQTYLGEVGHCPLLTNSEINAAAQLASGGYHKTAVNILVESQLRWAARVANRFYPVGILDQMDFIQTANLALISAVPNYDPQRASLPSFLERCIRNEINDEISKTTKKRELVENCSSFEQLEDLGLLKTSSDPFEDSACCRAEAPHLIDCLRALPPPLLEVLELHFGLDGNGPRSYKQIARQLQIGNKRVPILIEKALNQLRYALGVESPNTE